MSRGRGIGEREVEEAREYLYSNSTSSSSTGGGRGGWTNQIHNNLPLPLTNKYIPSNLKSTITKSDSDTSSMYYSADGNSTYEYDLGSGGGLGSSPMESRRNSYHSNLNSPKQQFITPSPSNSHIPSVLPSPAFFHPIRNPSISPRREREREREKEKKGIERGPKVTRIISEFEVPFTTSGIEEIRMRREGELSLSEARVGVGRASGSSAIPGTSYSNHPSHSNSNLDSNSNSNLVGQPSREPLLPFPPGSPTSSFNNNNNNNRTSSNYGEDPILIAGMRSTLQKARSSLKSSTSPSLIEGGDFGRKGDDSFKRLSRKGGILLPDENDEIPPSPPFNDTLSVQQFKNLRPISTQIPRPQTILLDEFGNPIRNHQLHSGSNRFCLKGRLLSSKDNPIPFIICLAIAIITPLLFFIFSGGFLWNHLGGSGKVSLFIFAWLAAIMLTNMLKTSWRDPGIIPRNLDKNPDRKWVEKSQDEPGGVRAEFKAQVRYIRMKDGVVASKWCDTCATYRPPRTSHCRLCDNCVSHTDHHCTFLNNCIGRRNYTSFITFLVTSILSSLYVISFSSYHIYTRHLESFDPNSDQYGIDWSKRYDSVGSFLVISLAFVVVWPLMGLLGYHVVLLISNRTTIEMLRPKGTRSAAMDPSTGKSVDNVYTHSTRWKNFVSLLCRPMEIPSFIEGNKFAMSDDRIDWKERGRERVGIV